MIQFDTQLLPPASVINADLSELGVSIRSYREPLKRAVQQVLAPSIQKNFDVGGRPPWPPLAEGTILDKTRAGLADMSPLVRTGMLRRVAGQLNIWTLNSDEAHIDSTGLPERAAYGRFHQTGTRNMPAREWAVIQDEDGAKVEEIFWAWIAERAAVVGHFTPGAVGTMDLVEGD